ncbi:hypothetical protein JHW43_007129 [Diplocarpon mali]|nr:hypothetical protein JHW43_007129 [Diplocarpon mali]
MDSHRQDFSLGYRDPASSLIMPPQEAPIPLPLQPLGRQLSGMDGTRPDNRSLGLQAPSQTHTYTIHNPHLRARLTPTNPQSPSPSQTHSYTIHNPRLRARLTPTQSTIPVSEPDSHLQIHNPRLRARLTPTQSTIPISEPDSLLHNPQSPSPSQTHSYTIHNPHLLSPTGQGIWSDQVQGARCGILRHPAAYWFVPVSAWSWEDLGRKVRDLPVLGGEGGRRNPMFGMVGSAWNVLRSLDDTERLRILYIRPSPNGLPTLTSEARPRHSTWINLMLGKPGPSHSESRSVAVTLHGLIRADASRVVRNAGFVAEQRRDDSYASAAAAPHAAAGKASGVDRATAVTPVLGVQGGKASPSPPPMRFEAFTEASITSPAPHAQSPPDSHRAPGPRRIPGLQCGLQCRGAVDATKVLTPFPGRVNTSRQDVEACRHTCLCLLSMPRAQADVGDSTRPARKFSRAGAGSSTAERENGAGSGWGRQDHRRDRLAPSGDLPTGWEGGRRRFARGWKVRPPYRGSLGARAPEPEEAADGPRGRPVGAAGVRGAATAADRRPGAGRVFEADAAVGVRPRASLSAPPSLPAIVRPRPGLRPPPRAPTIAEAQTDPWRGAVTSPASRRRPPQPATAMMRRRRTSRIPRIVLHRIPAIVIETVETISSNAAGAERT